MIQVSEYLANHRLMLFSQRNHRIKWGSVLMKLRTQSTESAFWGDEARKMIMKAIKVGREGADLIPNLTIQEYCNNYRSCTTDDKASFLLMLAKEFGYRETELVEKTFEYIKCVKEEKNDWIKTKAYENLCEATHPLYHRFFGQISQQPDGMKFLVDLRSDALNLLSRTDPRNVHLKQLEENLRKQLQSWFAVGFLDLIKVDWNSPASLLEKLIHYENVHPIPTWDVLKQRLGVSRRCYGFFHRSMRDEPLVFIHIALMDRIADTIQSILEESTEKLNPNPSKAIFYSINSTQKGLSGIDLGHFLIKRVVQELRSEFPETMHVFCTLSPVPGFRSWLLGKINFKLSTPTSTSPDDYFPDSIMTLLRNVFTNSLDPIKDLRNLMASDDFPVDRSRLEGLKLILMSLCAHYLVNEKKRSLAIDSVANFHLRNGAILHEIHWMADLSDKGWRQSCGIMVNYLYILPEIEANNRSYLLNGHVHCTDHVKRWLLTSFTNTM